MNADKVNWAEMESAHSRKRRARRSGNGPGCMALVHTMTVTTA